MLAGPLDRRLTILRATVTKGEFNADVETWLPIGTVWASREDLKDGERYRSQQEGASRTTRFQVRHSTLTASITAEDQATCEGQRYAIVAKPKEIGRREGYEITATAQVDVP